MRVAIGNVLKPGVHTFRAGSLYIELTNDSAITIAIRFGNLPDSNRIFLLAGETRVFPFLGAQGYDAFTIDNGSGGDIVTAYLIIIQ